MNNRLNGNFYRFRSPEPAASEFGTPVVELMRGFAPKAP